MNIHQDDPRLTAYALGELTGTDRDNIEEAIRKNPELGEQVEAIRSLGTRLEEELACENAPELNTAQRRRVTRPAQRRPKLLRFPSTPTWGVLIAAAAVIAVMLGSFTTIWLGPLRTTETGDTIAVEIARNDSYSRPLQYASETLERLESLENLPPPADSEGALHPSPLSSMPAKARRSDKKTTPSRDELTIIEQVSPLEIPGLFANRQSAGRYFTSKALGEALYTAEEAPPRSSYGPSIEHYEQINENPFRRVADHPLSTFSIDVDTASYANVRRFLNNGTLPPPDAVRIEELINYFNYNYAPPTDGTPFATHLEAAVCPWKPEHRIVRIGIKGRVIENAERPPCNLVFLLDVSGSMQDENKLPLVKRAMTMLVRNLNEHDRVAIVVYAGASGLVLPPTSCANKNAITDALDRLRAGGSTNGGQGIELAYGTAVEHFMAEGVNRVILCTDGDFNVGITQPGDLVRLVEENADKGVFLSVLGFGMGNYKDSTLEKLADKGNGNYAYVDTFNEARKVLVDQLTGTLVTIAKDVKIQVEFNPARVAGYRLIGYENRMLRKEDFNDDTKDAGEIGAGHTVTALYEIVPAGRPVTDAPSVDELKYQAAPAAPTPETARELLTVKIRYKKPDGDVSSKLEFPLADEGGTFENAGPDLKFASAVAGFGMLLRDSEYKGDISYDQVIAMAEAGLGKDRFGYRREFIQLVRNAEALSGQANR